MNKKIFSTLLLLLITINVFAQEVIDNIAHISTNTNYTSLKLNGDLYLDNNAILTLTEPLTGDGNLFVTNENQIKNLDLSMFDGYVVFNNISVATFNNAYTFNNLRIEGAGVVCNQKLTVNKITKITKGKLSLKTTAALGQIRIFEQGQLEGTSNNLIDISNNFEIEKGATVTGTAYNGVKGLRIKFVGQEDQNFRNYGNCIIAEIKVEKTNSSSVVNMYSTSAIEIKSLSLNRGTLEVGNNIVVNTTDQIYLTANSNLSVVGGTLKTSQEVFNDGGTLSIKAGQIVCQQINATKFIVDGGNVNVTNSINIISNGSYEQNSGTINAKTFEKKDNGSYYVKGGTMYLTGNFVVEGDKKNTSVSGGKLVIDGVSEATINSNADIWDLEYNCNNFKVTSDLSVAHDFVLGNTSFNTNRGDTKQYTLTVGRNLKASSATGLDKFENIYFVGNQNSNFEYKASAQVNNIFVEKDNASLILSTDILCKTINAVNSNVDCNAKILTVNGDKIDFNSSNQTGKIKITGNNLNLYAENSILGDIVQNVSSVTLNTFTTINSYEFASDGKCYLNGYQLTVNDKVYNGGQNRFFSCNVISAPSALVLNVKKAQSNGEVLFPVGTNDTYASFTIKANNGSQFAEDLIRVSSVGKRNMLTDKASANQHWVVSNLTKKSIGSFTYKFSSSSLLVNTNKKKYKANALCQLNTDVTKYGDDYVWINGSYSDNQTMTFTFDNTSTNYSKYKFANLPSGDFYNSEGDNYSNDVYIATNKSIGGKILNLDGKKVRTDAIWRKVNSDGSYGSPISYTSIGEAKSKSSIFIIENATAKDGYEMIVDKDPNKKNDNGHFFAGKLTFRAGDDVALARVYILSGKRIETPSLSGPGHIKLYYVAKYGSQDKTYGDGQDNGNFCGDYSNFDLEDRSVWEYYSEKTKTGYVEFNCMSYIRDDWGENWNEAYHDFRQFPNLIISSSTNRQYLVKEKDTQNKKVGQTINVRGYFKLNNVKLALRYNYGINCGDLIIENGARLQMPQNGGTTSVNVNNDITLGANSYIELSTANNENINSNNIPSITVLGNILGSGTINLYNNNKYATLHLKGSNDAYCDETIKYTPGQIFIEKDFGKKFEFKNNVTFATNNNLENSANYLLKPVQANSGELIFSNTNQTITFSKDQSYFVINKDAKITLNNIGEVKTNELQIYGGLEINGKTKFIVENAVKYGNTSLNRIDINSGASFSAKQLYPIENEGNLVFNVNTFVPVVIGKNDLNLNDKGLFNLTKNCTFNMIEGDGTNHSSIEFYASGLQYHKSPTVNIEAEYGNLGKSSVLDFEHTIGYNQDNNQTFTLYASKNLQNVYIGKKNSNGNITVVDGPITILGNLDMQKSSRLNTINDISIYGNTTIANSSKFYANKVYFYGDDAQFNLQYKYEGVFETEDFIVNKNAGKSLIVKAIENFNACNANTLILGNLTINSGILKDNATTINVTKTYTNMDTYTWSGTGDGILICNGTKSGSCNFTNQTAQEIISNGINGKITLNNSKGAFVSGQGNVLEIVNDLNMQNGKLLMNNNILKMYYGATISGSGFGPEKMIEFEANVNAFGLMYCPKTGDNQKLLPIGNQKYTPVIVSCQSVNNDASILIKPYNQEMPVDYPCDKHLPYYWDLLVNNINSFVGNITFTHGEGNSFDDSNYICARLDDGQTSWNKISKGYNSKNNTLTYEFDSQSPIASGSYTAGTDECLPDLIEEFVSTLHGGAWDDPNSWEGGKVPTRGSNIVIKAPITVSANNLVEYNVTIEKQGELILNSTVNHQFKSVSGEGKISQINTGELPSASYDNFIERGTLQFTNNSADGFFILNQFNNVNNLILKGSQAIKLPTTHNVVIKGDLTIEGTDNFVLENSKERAIVLEGDFDFVSGKFSIFDRAINTLVLQGNKNQVIKGNFVGDDCFIGNLEINNNYGVTILGQVELRNLVTFQNNSGCIVTISEGGKLFMSNKDAKFVNADQNHFVEGAICKFMENGETFVFPLGDNGRYASTELKANGQGEVTIEYHNKASDIVELGKDVKEISSNEYWSIIASKDMAVDVKLRFDQNSHINKVDNSLNIVYAGDKWELLTTFYRTGTKEDGGNVVTQAFAVNPTMQYLTFSTDEPSWYNWIGEVSSNWNDNGNWQSNQIPDENSDVKIKADAKYQPIINISDEVKINNLFVEEGASLIVPTDKKLTVNNKTIVRGTLKLTSGQENQNLGTFISTSVDGKISVVRGLSSACWYRVATPFDGLNSNAFTWGHGKSYYNGNFLLYKENTVLRDDKDFDKLSQNELEGTSLALSLGWEYIAKSKSNPAKAILRTVGYDYYSFDKSNITLSGVPKFDRQTLNASYTDNDRSNVYDGWNCFGNPYTANIDWSKVEFKGNVDHAVYIMDTYKSTIAQEGEKTVNYMVYSAGESVGATNENPQYIPVMQAFFVHAQNGGGQVIINKDALTHQCNIRFNTAGLSKKAVSQNRIRLVANNSDDIIVKFAADTKNGFDNKLDAYKMFSKAENVVEIYSIEGDNKLCINNYDESCLDNTVIKLGYSLVGNNKQATILAKEFSSDNARAIFVDKKEGVEEEIYQGFSYTFLAEEGEDNNRFEIRYYQNHAPIINNAPKSVSIYQGQKLVESLPNDMFVDNDINDQVVDVQVYNLPKFVEYKSNKFVIKPSENDFGYYTINIVAYDKFGAMTSFDYLVEVLALQKENNIVEDNNQNSQNNNLQEDNLENNSLAKIVNVYPNPVADVLTIEVGDMLDNSNSVDLILFEATGKVLKRQKVYSQKFEFDMSKFNQGVYFIRLNNQSSYQTFKLIKK